MVAEPSDGLHVLRARRFTKPWMAMVALALMAMRIELWMPSDPEAEAPTEKIQEQLAMNSTGPMTLRSSTARSFPQDRASTSWTSSTSSSFSDTLSWTSSNGGGATTWRISGRSSMAPSEAWWHSLKRRRKRRSRGTSWRRRAPALDTEFMAMRVLQEWRGDCNWVRVPVDG